MIKFKDKGEYFKTQQHLADVAKVITEKADLPNYNLSYVYYNDDPDFLEFGLTFIMSDDMYEYKIAVPDSFWDMSVKEVEKVLSKLDKLEVKYSYLNLKELIK